jgi:hypothetical protein
MTQRAPTTFSMPALVPVAYRIEMAVFLAVVAFTYLTITRPFVHGNPAARIGLTMAIVERGELNIDPLVAEGATDDWARHGGHFYSNKAPGPALLAVPLYFVQHRIQRALGVADSPMRARWAAMYVANVATSIVPTLLAMPLLFAVLMRRLGLTPGWAFALCGTWAVASMALPYSVVFFGHQSAAAFFAIGMCLTALELERAGAPRPGVVCLAGLAMGLAVLCDYFAAPLVAVWTCYLVWRTRLAPRVLVAWAAGGVGPLMVLMVYHAVCFGSPFTMAYAPSILNPQFAPDTRLEWPSVDRLLDITGRPRRGLFYATPVFALMLVGLARLREKAPGRPELIAAAAGVVLLLGLLAAYPYSSGTYSIGQRFFTPALPLALFLVAGGARTLPRVFGALLLASTLLMLSAALVEPLPPEEHANPFRDIIFPALVHNGPSQMRNLTFFLGAPLVGALGAYLTLWAGLTVWLLARLRAEGRPNLPEGRPADLGSR